ncbi:hypothetical protein LTR28_009561 [Elasticomyces elasticus]|nr:hypothetical protein LTR28_009561 [Elasticomyces elasticus]
MGYPGGPTTVTQTAFSYTSTRSIFSMHVGTAISMNITFLSPVTPTDMLRQSIPFSYMMVEIQSLDGNKHDVQLYSDVSAAIGRIQAGERWTLDELHPKLSHPKLSNTGTFVQRTELEFFFTSDLRFTVTNSVGYDA